MSFDSHDSVPIITSGSCSRTNNLNSLALVSDLILLQFKSANDKSLFVLLPFLYLRFLLLACPMTFSVHALINVEF